MNSQQKKAKGVVDIVFLIDVTGSMEPCIDALKTNINTFLESLTAKDANGNTLVSDWRAMAVGYRDVEADGPDWFVSNPFVDNVEMLRSQLASLEAMGGGDEPESLLEGLHKVISMPSTERGEQAMPDQWRYRSDAMRAVVVFSDASFKRDLVEPAGATIKDVQSLLMSNRIVLTVFAPPLDFYHELALVDKCKVHPVTGGADPQDSLAIFTSDPAKFQETMLQLGKTLSATVAATPL